MRRAQELMTMHLMQQLAATAPLPDHIHQAFLAADRVFPNWRVPQTNLSNPPRVDAVDEALLGATIAYTCPVCHQRKTLMAEREADLRGLADDLAVYRTNRLCAHDADVGGV